MRCQISAVGSCEGTAAGPRQGAGSGARKGAATFQRTGPPRNLTLKIKFGAANICSKFEKFCQILSAHCTSCDFDGSCVPTNRNLNKCEISIIIYIESERENK